MLDGNGSFWGWWRGADAAARWAAWRGTNAGFDQSINAATNGDTPTPIKTPDGPHPVGILTRPSLDGGYAARRTGSFAGKEQVLTLSWLRPLGEPVRFPLGLAAYQQQALALVQAEPFAEAVSVDRSLLPLSEPVRRVALTTAMIVASGLFAPVPPPVVAGVDSWQRPLAEPVRRLVSPAAAPSFFEPPSLFVAAEVVTVDKWYAALATPVRRIVSPAVVPAAFEPPAELIRPGSWFSELATPIRWRGLSTSIVASGPSAPVPPPVVAGADAWQRPLSEPVRRIGLPSHEQISCPFVPTAPFTEAVSVGEWLVPLAEPVRFPRALPSHEQQALAFVKAAPFAEAVSLDKWLQPLSGPPRSSATPASEQPASVFVGSDAARDLLWLRPLADPIRPQRAADYSALSYAYWVADATETVTLDKWVAPLALPTRGAVSPSAVPALFEPPSELIRPGSWFRPLAEPPRRLGLGAEQQQSLAFVASVAAVVTPDWWFAPLSVPIRRLDRDAAQQQASAFVVVVEGAASGADQGWLAVHIHRRASGRR